MILSGGGHVLLGSERSERLVGLDGLDTIYGRAGDDVIDVQNGVPDDAVDCGAGHDAVRADPGDSIATSCERRL